MVQLQRMAYTGSGVGTVEVRLDAKTKEREQPEMFALELLCIQRVSCK